MNDGMIEVRSVEGITVVTINRPAKRNAMTIAMCQDLAIAWQKFRESDDRAAVLTGTGDVFCAGADLTDPPEKFWKTLPGIGIDIGKPVITAVNGAAIGFGLGLVVFSDLCVASKQARFVYPEVRVGVSKGLMSALAVRIPHKVALELMLTGEPVGAQRAYEVGLVNCLAEPGQELDGAMSMARTFTKSAPMVVKLLKDLVDQTVPRSPVETLYRTHRKVDAVFASQDAAEGLRAFKEKRAPRYTGC